MPPNKLADFFELPVDFGRPHSLLSRNINSERIMTMRTPLILVTTLLAAAMSPAAEQSDAGAAFSKLKTLVGEWTADTQMGKAHLVYELTAGGTALMERESAEKMPEMVTVYHLDGN